MLFIIVCRLTVAPIADRLPFAPHRLSRLRLTSAERADSLASASAERADSLSSGGEEDDDDDQFDFFTAESLFGNLMDRMKSLTKRMDMDDNPAKVGDAGTRSDTVCTKVQTSSMDRCRQLHQYEMQLNVYYFCKV